MKKIIKGLTNINDVLDDRYQKLYDRFHDLELSHKRMERLLRQVVPQLELFADLATEFDRPVFIPYTDLLVIKIKAELSHPYLCRNWGYTHKQEPGHYCE